LTPRQLYVDEDPHKDLAPRLSEVGHLADSTMQLGLKGRSDPWQLAFAARERRTFVTCNFKHFEMLHEAWTSWSAEWGIGPDVPHAGILIIPNGREISLDQMVAIVAEILERESSLDNRLFRWRQSTRWLDLFPGARQATPNPARREGDTPTA
jgi:hypothetical protein